MKILIVLIGLIGASLAIKTQRPNGKFTRFQRVQSFQPAFARQQQQPVPHDVYGPPPTPSTQYGPPPSSEYGPPSSEEPTTETPTTTELPTTTESLSEKVNTTSRLTQNKNRGVYYIYHPSGLLQRVVYSTKKDAKNMAYTAQVKYEDVEPIRAPIFTYDPQTLVLNRLQI